MSLKKKLRKKQLKAKISKEKRKELKKIVKVLADKGCRTAKFEVNAKNSEFTISELQAFCDLHGFGLYGIHKEQICIPSKADNGVLFMSF